MHQHTSLFAAEPRHSGRGGRQAALVARAREIMSADPSAPHRITHLAGTLRVSPFHLAHIFRARVGLSLHQYLLRLRMQLAIERLRCGEASISRLAADLGFSSHSHFTAVFRKHFGVGPAEWRARLGRETVRQPESVTAGAA